MEISEILQGTQNTLIIVRRDDLIEFATTYASRVQANQPKEISKEDVEQPISQSKAVEFLGKSRQTLIKWRRDGIIKGYRLGGRVYYKPSELVLALKKLS